MVEKKQKFLRKVLLTTQLNEKMAKNTAVFTDMPQVFVFGTAGTAKTLSHSMVTAYFVSPSGRRVRTYWRLTLRPYSKAWRVGRFIRGWGLKRKKKWLFNTGLDPSRKLEGVSKTNTHQFDWALTSFDAAVYLFCIYFSFKLITGLTALLAGQEFQGKTGIFLGFHYK